MISWTEMSLIIVPTVKCNGIFDSSQINNRYDTKARHIHAHHNSKQIFISFLLI